MNLPNLAEKRDRLLNLLAEWRHVAVAFSAGVDSTVLAQAAQLACQQNAIAVLANSPSIPSGTVEEAQQLARQIGIPLKVIDTNEFQRPEYLANAGDRCYFCKQTLYTTMAGLPELSQGYTLVNGTNTDDLGDYRPGLQAARELEVRSPFVEVGLNKAEIRQLARDWELPVWDKPAAPCLSSRIAHGLEVTAERVRRVDQAEQFLRQLLNISELRVRHEFHDLARIEIPRAQLVAICTDDLFRRIEQQLKQLGFRYVTIDLTGFRSGSLNDTLPLVTLQHGTNTPRSIDEL